jgi:hypothetical protein
MGATPHLNTFRDGNKEAHRKRDKWQHFLTVKEEIRENGAVYE